MFKVMAKYPDSETPVHHGSWLSLEMAERIADATYRTIPSVERVWIEIETVRDRAQRIDREMGVSE